MRRNREALVERLPLGIGCEIGVWRGDFSQHLLKKATKLHLVDPWLHQPEFKGRMYARKDQEEIEDNYNYVVERFKDDPVVIYREFSHQFLERTPDKYLDWIYIDGNHAYEWVKKDIELALEKSHLVCGDDLSFEGVKKALEPYDYEVMGNQWLIR